LDKKILVVDDSKVEGIYIKFLLDKLDKVDATVCPGFEEALELAEKDKYDLIIADYYTIDGTSDMLIEDIREKCEKNAETPVVAMGRDIDFAEENFLKNNGFINYIEKPVEFNMLKAVVALYS